MNLDFQLAIPNLEEALRRRIAREIDSRAVCVPGVQSIPLALGAESERCVVTQIELRDVTVRRAFGSTRLFGADYGARRSPVAVEIDLPTFTDAVLTTEL